MRLLKGPVKGRERFLRPKTLRSPLWRGLKMAYNAKRALSEKITVGPKQKFRVLDVVFEFVPGRFTAECRQMPYLAQCYFVTDV